METDILQKNDIVWLNMVDVMERLKRGKGIERCVCVRERGERESLCVSMCLERVGCNFKYGDREGFTEKVTFKQIHEEVGEACVKA